MTIFYHAEKYSNRQIVPETVFAVGHNRDFIIAKSHPNNNKNVTYYHIIEIAKKSTNQSPNLTLEQFENRKKQLNVPKELNFDIVFDELK